MLLQAYTSQILAIVMFALKMSEDRLSMLPRRKEIIDGLKCLHGEYEISAAIYLQYANYLFFLNMRNLCIVFYVFFLHLMQHNNNNAIDFICSLMH